MTVSGRSGSFRICPDYTERPAGLETKDAAQIAARASDPHRGLSTRSFTRECPGIKRVRSARLGRSQGFTPSRIS
jgi:hypothetical protein